VDQAQRIELLETDDPDKVMEALADLAAHGSTAEWNQLVAGYSAEGGWLAPEARKRGPLRGTQDRQHLRGRTMLALVGAAPDGTDAAAMRELVDRIWMTGSRAAERFGTSRPGERCTLDLTTLVRFPRLRSVTLEKADGVPGMADLLAAGRLAELWLSEVVVDELDLSACQRLEKIRFQDLPTLASLRGLPASLREMLLYELPALREVPLGASRGLEILDIDNQSPLPRPAAQLGALRKLNVYRWDPEWLAQLTGLESLSVWNMESLAPVTGMKALKKLGVHAAPGDLVSVPLALPHLEELAILYIEQLTSLAGMAGSELPALRTLKVNTNGLVSLAGLESLDTVTEAVLVGDALSDISAVAGWHRLAKLSLCSMCLTDVTPLAGLRALRSLDLSRSRKLRDLTPIAGLELEQLDCSNSDVTKSGVPESFHAIVQPPSLVAKRKASKPRGVKPKPVSGKDGARTTFARLKKLLLTRDWDQLNQGLELLRSLDDPALYEGLLSGSTMAHQERGKTLSRHHATDGLAALPDGYDLVVPNALLAHGPTLRPYREALIRALVAQAPAGCETAATLREAWKRLFATGTGRDYGNPGPIDLGPLASLPHLTDAVISRADGLENVDAIARAAQLRSLALLWVKQADLTGLASETVRTLVVIGAEALETSFDFAGFPRVETLVFQPSSDFEPKGVFPRLRSADIERGLCLLPALSKSPLEELVLRGPGDARRLAPMTASKTLTSLRIEYGDDMPDLSPLTALTSLRRLSLRRCAPRGIGVLAGLPELEELEIWRTTLTEADALALAGMPRLTRLVLDREVEVAAPLPPSLAERTTRLGS
jgi:hypothetical protein